MLVMQANTGEAIFVLPPPEILSIGRNMELFWNLKVSGAKDR